MNRISGLTGLLLGTCSVGMPAHHVHRFKCAPGASCTVFVVLDANDQSLTLERALAADRESNGNGW